MFTRRKNATSSICSFTKLAGVQQKKIVMTQRAVSMRTTRGIFDDHPIYSSMRLRTAKHSRTEWDGTTVIVV